MSKKNTPGTAYVGLAARTRALCRKAWSLWPAARVPHVKPSKLRYKMRCADVDAKVSAALRSADYSNPYPPDDKRHARFARNLYQRRAAQTLFEI